MGYTRAQFEEVVEELGEVFFVLESGEEYIVHGTDGYEIDTEVRGSSPIARIEGIRDGEYLKVAIPLSSIEHHYTHKEV